MQLNQHDPLKISLQEATEQLKALPEPFILLFKRGDFSTELFAPQDIDTQQPHEQDEVYLIASGSGLFLRGEERVSFVQGDFLFVPAGVVHRFDKFSKDFKTWVLFFGPKGGSHGKAQSVSLNTASNLTDHTSMNPPYTLRSHKAGDLGLVVQREGLIYTEEFGWDQTLEGFVAGIVSDFIANFDPSLERCWIAEKDGQHLGHIFLVKSKEQPGTARLRLLCVEREARGLGVGKVLVKECVAFARAAGYSKITLWTQSILKAAHRLYHEAGFRLVKEEPHHSFGKDLVGQEWELDLR
jgi:GNAT superfamily N-acetyltransferase